MSTARRPWLFVLLACMTLLQACAGLKDRRALRDTLVRDDRFGFGTQFVARGDTLVAGTHRLARLRDSKPADAPPALARLVGEYGWDHDILYIVERRGRIEALTDWFYRSPLTRLSDSTFRFPAGSRYDSEPVAFAFDATGAVSGVRIGWSWFPRRAIAHRPVPTAASAASAARPTPSKVL